MLSPRTYSIIACLFVAFCVTKNDPALAITAPPQAAEAGYKRLVFDEEFDGPPDIGYGTAGHKWNAGLWWEPVPSPSQFIVKDGVLTIKGANSLCTQFHDHSGGTYFKGGYFEARMLCTEWSAFWLFDANRPTVWGNSVTADPATWTSEIDVIETDPGPAYAHTVVTTVHKNSSGDGGIPDEQNPNNNNRIPGRAINEWHTYGVLWTQAEVTWYVDDVKVCTYPAYPSTWHPMQLILSAHPGGVNGSAPTGTPATTTVDWVRVWH